MNVKKGEVNGAGRLARCHMTKFIWKTLSKSMKLGTWMALIYQETQSVSKLKLQPATLDIVNLRCFSRNASLTCWNS